MPVNAYALRPGRTGLTYVALAGPMANFAVAAVVAVIFRGAAAGRVCWTLRFLREVVALIVYFNVALGLFNLIPIPPLDGYNVVAAASCPATVVHWCSATRSTAYIVLLLLLVLSYWAGERARWAGSSALASIAIAEG